MEKKQHFWRESENFPILYENVDIVVFKNPAGEIFVQKTSRVADTEGPCIRIGCFGHTELVVTANNGGLIPWAVNGVSAFRVKSPT